MAKRKEKKDVPVTPEYTKLTIQKLASKDVSKMLKNTALFDQLIKDNRGFVESAVLSVIQKQRNHIHFDDLYQVGLIGLWHACSKFNAEKAGAAKFSTYAYKTIQNSVRQELKGLNKHSKTFSINYLNFDNTGEPNETRFIETTQINSLRNFENELLTKIELEKQLAVLSPMELKFLQLKFKDKKSLAQTAEELKIKFTTLRKWYYTEGKQKYELIGQQIYGD